MRTIEDVDDNDICINFGCIEDCIKCNLMCNPQCANYGSRNTRQKILDKLHESIELEYKYYQRRF